MRYCDVRTRVRCDLRNADNRIPVVDRKRSSRSRRLLDKEKTFGPPSINMPGTPASPAVRKCGALLRNVMDPVAQCPKCAFDLDARNSS